jgi:YbbR domain-containing protein
MPRFSEWFSGRFSSTDLVRLGSSLILALILWGWVTAREDPETSRPFSNVTVAVPELPGNLVVLSAPPTAIIRLTGPESVINEIDASEVTAELDLSEVDEPGSYNVPIEITAPDGVWERRSTPSRVQIQVEESVAQQFAIQPVIEGELPANRRVGTIVPEVSDVTVRGPSSVVSRVTQVVLPISTDVIGNQTRDFRGSFTPVARDENGQAVTEVEISPSTMTAVVPVEAAGKSVAVFTQIIGVPAQGMEVLDRAVIPVSVTIDGPQELLDTIVFVTTEPVDVTGATGNISVRVGLEGIPDGVTVLNPPDGRVEVSVQIGQRGVRQELPGLRVEVINLDQGLQATVDPSDVTVIVVASSDLLAQLTASDLIIHVDAAGLGPGEHLLKPTVSLPPNVQWISTNPAEVLVTIQATVAADATPATPGPDPVASPSPAG